MGFWDGVASVGPYANNLHLAADKQPPQCSIFYMPDAFPVTTTASKH